MPPTRISKVAPLLVAGILAGGILPAIAAPLAPVAPTAPEAPATPRRVLILYSYSRLLPGNVAFENGIRQSLLATGSPAIELFDEFLDLPRFRGPDYLRTMETYLREKYAARPPEIVIAAGGIALQFMVEHRGSLFPGIPVVHGAVEREELTSIPGLAALPAGVLGVPVAYDFAGTIDQALRFHPRARRLVIVTGQAEKDRQWEARLHREVHAFEPRVSVEFLAALPARDLLLRLGKLGTESVVFTPGFFQDGDGRTFTPRESTEAMAAASGAPVYSTFTTTIGTDVVGGRMPSFEEFGREAGREVLALLAGAAPAAVALEVPAAAPSALHLDWRQVLRWRIDERAVPADAVAHFREPTLFEAHRIGVLLTAGALAFQAALIALLLFERRRRQAAELAEQGRRSELAHASRLAVAGELLGSIAHEINQPLGAILANADAADLILLAGGDRRADLAEILVNIRRDDLRASEVIRKLRSLVAGHEVERRRFEVEAVVREVESLLRSEARRRRVTLEIQPAGAATPVVGDRIQLQQVLLNLVLNAMDAVADAPEDRRAIVLTVRNSASTVEISVLDRGNGIAPEHLPKLFDSFFTTKSKGMGLGLSIARTLVEAHGGRIRAESRPGEGALFRIDLPAAPAIASPEPPAPQASLPSQPAPPAPAPGTA